MSRPDYPDDIFFEISQYLSFKSLVAWSLTSRAYFDVLTRVILHKLGPCPFPPSDSFGLGKELDVKDHVDLRKRQKESRGGDLFPTTRLSRSAVLVWAASRGHVRLVRTILSARGMRELINTPILSSGFATYPGGFGMTPLHAAAEGGHADVIDVLVEHGADVEVDVDGGLRAIHFASSEDAVMALVRHGSFIHYRRNISPVTYLIGPKSHLSSIRCFLRLRCDPNAHAWFGLTPVDAAVQAGNVEALQLLLDAGLDVSASTQMQESLIFKAIFHHQNSDPDLAHRLIRVLLGHKISGTGTMQKAWTRSTFRPRYSYCGWIPFIVLFQLHPGLVMGFLLNTKDALCQVGDPSQSADGYLAMASTLVEYGASLDARRETSTLLKYLLASDNHYPEARERLLVFLLEQLAGKPLTHCGNTVRRQPIHFLFTRGYNFFGTNANTELGLRITKRFLSLGADPNEPDSAGETPLALLCQLPLQAYKTSKRRNSNPAEMLLKHGADINTLWDAENCAIYRIVAQVSAWKKDENVYNWYFESVSSQDCNLEHRDSDGMTPLGRLTSILFVGAPFPQWREKKKQYFAWRRADFLSFLLKMGADVHAKQGQSEEKPLCAGGTPLHSACYDFDPTMLRMLLDHGAGEDVNKVTDKGFTPLMLVAAAVRDGILGEPEAREMEQMLWNAGAEKASRHEL